MIRGAALLRLVIVPALSLAGIASALPARDAQAAVSSGLQIRVLSTRADLVSGGEALVAIDVPAGVDPAAVHVTLGGLDISSTFAIRANGVLEGLVTSLQLGPNQLTATAARAGGATLTITDHPNGGPVFSGPQIQPWTCQAGATDSQCDAPVSYSYEYMPPGGTGTCFIGTCATSFQSYDPNNPPPPPAMATATTDNGQTVPYIVRVETGYEDRNEYQVAVLFTPSAAWKPWAPQPQWDDKLEYWGGASCGTVHGTGSPPGVLDDTALQRGIMVASSTLANNGQDCNHVTQAESVEMLKEHIVDTYGPIKYTMGAGCSGGSIFQHVVANAYPGLLDGITPQCSFTDEWSTQHDPDDCALLLSYWNSSTGQNDNWTTAQQAAVAGDSTIAVCQTWVNFYGYNTLMNPSSTKTACGLASGQEYNASTNPNGLRCDTQDYMANVMGLRPPSSWGPVERKIGHGFANSPYDNVGVQYGLAALLAGTITPQQFVDLNTGIGGYDIDGVAQTARSVADPAGLVNVYRTGGVNEGNNLADVPIIDLRGHDDTEIHSDYHTYAMRGRLDAFNGGHDNQVAWTGPIALTGTQGSQAFNSKGLLELDKWLTNIHNDTSGATLAHKVVADRPADAVDTCFDAAGNPIPVQSTCPTLYPSYGDPRIAAGLPSTDDVLKCQVKIPVRSDYPGVTFTDAQWAQLNSAYPTGVCNATKPGVGQQATVPWLAYQDAAGNHVYGGTPLGPAPVSQPLGPQAAVAETVWQPALLMVGLAVALVVRRRGRQRPRNRLPAALR